MRARVPVPVVPVPSSGKKRNCVFIENRRYCEDHSRSNAQFFVMFVPWLATIALLVLVGRLTWAVRFFLGTMAVLLVYAFVHSLFVLASPS